MYVCVTFVPSCFRLKGCRSTNGVNCYLAYHFKSLGPSLDGKTRRLPDIIDQVHLFYDRTFHLLAGNYYSDTILIFQLQLAAPTAHSISKPGMSGLLMRTVPAHASTTAATSAAGTSVTSMTEWTSYVPSSWRTRVLTSYTTL